MRRIQLKQQPNSCDMGVYIWEKRSDGWYLGNPVEFAKREDVGAYPEPTLVLDYPDYIDALRELHAQTEKQLPVDDAESKRLRDQREVEARRIVHALMQTINILLGILNMHTDGPPPDTVAEAAKESLAAARYG